MPHHIQREIRYNFEYEKRIRACFIGAGCISGGTDLPTIDMDQRILSIDPGSMKILDGLLPPADGNPLSDREPLAEIPILNRKLTLEGGLSATGVPGFKITETAGATLLNTMPPTPPSPSTWLNSRPMFPI